MDDHRHKDNSEQTNKQKKGGKPIELWELEEKERKNKKYLGLALSNGDKCWVALWRDTNNTLVLLFFSYSSGTRKNKIVYMGYLLFLDPPTVCGSLSLWRFRRGMLVPMHRLGCRFVVDHVPFVPTGNWREIVQGWWLLMIADTMLDGKRPSRSICNA